MAKNHNEPHQIISWDENSIFTRNFDEEGKLTDTATRAVLPYPIQDISFITNHWVTHGDDNQRTLFTPEFTIRWSGKADWVRPESARYLLIGHGPEEKRTFQIVQLNNKESELWVIDPDKKSDEEEKQKEDNIIPSWPTVDLAVPAGEWDIQVDARERRICAIKEGSREWIRLNISGKSVDKGAHGEEGNLGPRPYIQGVGYLHHGWERIDGVIYRSGSGGWPNTGPFDISDISVTSKGFITLDYSGTLRFLDKRKKDQTIAGSINMHYGQIIPDRRKRNVYAVDHERRVRYRLENDGTVDKPMEDGDTLESDYQGPVKVEGWSVWLMKGEACRWWWGKASHPRSPPTLLR